MDGIFAIAATLLVLDLRLPKHVPAGHLGEELTHLWPQYLAYALGFLQIMTGWLAIRRVSAWMTAVDHYATLGMLLILVTFILTPFTTSVLASSVHNRDDFASAVRLMSIVLLATMLIYGPTLYYLVSRGFLRPDLNRNGGVCSGRLAIQRGFGRWPRCC